MSQFAYVVIGAVAILVAGGILAGFAPQAPGADRPSGDGTSLFFEQIGTVGALDEAEPSSRDILMDGFTVEETSPNSTAFQQDEIRVRNTVLNEDTATITFDAFRPQKAYLRFISTRATDPDNLVLTVNGETVPVPDFTHDTRATIPIEDDHLNPGENVIRLTVKEPGWAFWRRPAFVFEDVQVVLTDLQNREVVRPFEAFDYESQGFAHGELHFTVQDETIRDEPLDITLNGNPVATRLPVKRAEPYTIRFFANTTGLRHGENVLSFRTSGDSHYPLSNVRLSLMYHAQTEEHTVVRDIDITENQYDTLGSDAWEGRISFNVARIFVERPLTLAFGERSTTFTPVPGENTRTFNQEHVEPGANQLTLSTDGAYRLQDFNVSLARTG